MMTPEQRTLNVLKSLDEKLGCISPNSTVDDDGIRKAVRQISNTLHWMTACLDLKELIDFIDDNQYNLNHADAIKELLNEPFFNVRKAH